MTEPPDQTATRPRERSFMEVVAHELRTPLAAILGYQELAAEGLYGPLPDGADDAMRRIGRSARQLLALVDGLDILEDGEPPEAGAASVVDVAALLKDAEASVAAEASARRMEVRLEVADDLPVLEADGTLVVRLVDLLVGALFKAASAGSYVLAATHDGAGVILSVRGGPFDPAVDAPERVADVATGAGLRLLMARRIARRLKGRLELAADGTLSVHIPSR